MSIEWNLHLECSMGGPHTIPSAQPRRIASGAASQKAVGTRDTGEYGEYPWDVIITPDLCIRSSACAMDPGVQYSSAKMAQEAAVSVIPTPAAVIASSMTDRESSCWKRSTIGCRSAWHGVFFRRHGGRTASTRGRGHSCVVERSGMERFASSSVEGFRGSGCVVTKSEPIPRGGISAIPASDPPHHLLASTRASKRGWDGMDSACTRGQT